MTDSAPRSTVARQGSHLRQSVAALLRGLDSDDPVFLALAEGFFDCCDDVYLLQRDLSEILSQWRDLRTWIAQRDSGGILVRLFNPSISKNGYSLERSILQTCMPDQPFLLDTLRKVLGDLDIEPNRCIHPILGAGRNPSGELVDLYPLPKEGVALESIIHFELPTLPKKQDRQRVLKAVHGRLLVIQQVVADFDAMKDRARWMASHLSEMYLEGDQAALRQVAVVQKFLQWLGDEHFVFAGYEEFGVEADGRPVSVPDSGLGIRRAGLEGGTFPNSAEDWLNGSTPWTASPIFLAKGETEAGLHRAGKADDILVRLEGDGSSQRIGLFTGLYTLKAITQEVQQIPLVREKLEQVLAAPNVVDGSHLQRKLEEAFRSIPVEFLLGANVDAIGRALKLIIAAEEEQETGVHLLVDSRRRTAFVLVSLHRERYDEEVRQAIARRLMDALGANYMDWRLAFRQSGHVVLQFFLTAPKVFRNVEPAELTNAVAAVAGSWAGLLAKVLSTRGGDGSEALSARYAAAFPDPYRSSTDPAQAADDVLLLDQVHKSGRIVVRISPTADDLVSGVTAIRIYQPKKIYLTESTPVLNDFGLKVIDQASVTVSPRGSDEDALFIDVLRVVPAEKKVNLDEHKEHLTNAIERILDGKARRDGLNALVLSAGLTWQEVDVLRAYIAYSRQLGAPAPFETVYQTWRTHAGAAKLLLRLFRSRFKPGMGPADSRDRQRLVNRNRGAFLDYLDGVELAADDRILRRSFNLVEATLRTNLWAGATLDGHPLSFKLDCSQIDEMPAPRPYREIWVQHLDVEGVHLRGGPVARGGLRWSDRPADFRTEILGLMETQMVKNVLIVPVGAKGGFVINQKHATYAETRVEADRCYQIFIRGLLDLTDNVVDGEVVGPSQVVRYDSDDPYLVVAADKGTAHLSDTANGVAEAYGFWLGDAFASGGSAGYDHKKYGITAKGAWVCVRRHFRELGMDPEIDCITACGIGDMSGDVFGNGMLLSKTIKLLAAFNHLHIFLDPDPDPSTSWKERKRLFDLPRSTWKDYEEGLLSNGGGIFPRHAKAIPLTPEVQRMLGVDDDELGGDKLVNTILKAEVDLLWNGGIGTYVKASGETERAAGDPANDAVRVNANQLRARVVGEGGNLGFTAAGRVEFARFGGRINADSLDNSGGVDMSDHEVNLKILFAALEREGLVQREGRDRILAEIAEEVSTAVQTNNDRHSQMISMDRGRCDTDLNDFRVLLNDLEASGRVDRQRNVLPSDGELLKRMGSGERLLRPELTRIGPFVKMEVYETLVADPRFDTPYIDRWLLGYFPKKLHTKKFLAAIRNHQLRKEIAATVITNELVDSMGATHFSVMGRMTGRDPAEIAYASLLSSDLLDSWTIKSALTGMKGVQASAEYSAIRRVETSVANLAQWLLQNDVEVLQPTAALKRLAQGFRDYEADLPRILTRSEKSLLHKRQRHARNRNIKAKGAERSSLLEWLVEAGDAVLLTETHPDLDAVQAGMLLKRIASDTHILEARRLATRSDAQDGWEARAITELRSNMSQLIVSVAKRLLQDLDLSTLNETKSGRRKILNPGLTEAWETFRNERAATFRRADELHSRIDAARARGLAPAMVLYSAVRGLRT